MFWIAANHGIEGAVSALAAGKNCWPTIPRNVNFEPIQALLDNCLSISNCHQSLRLASQYALPRSGPTRRGFTEGAETPSNL